MPIGRALSFPSLLPQNAVMAPLHTSVHAVDSNTDLHSARPVALRRWELEEAPGHKSPSQEAQVRRRFANTVQSIYEKRLTLLLEDTLATLQSGQYRIDEARRYLLLNNDELESAAQLMTEMLQLAHELADAVADDSAEFDPDNISHAWLARKTLQLKKAQAQLAILHSVLGFNDIEAACCAVLGQSWMPQASRDAQRWLKMVQPLFVPIHCQRTTALENFAPEQLALMQPFIGAPLNGPSRSLFGQRNAASICIPIGMPVRDVLVCDGYFREDSFGMARAQGGLLQRVQAVRSLLMHAPQSREFKEAYLQQCSVLQLLQKNPEALLGDFSDIEKERKALQGQGVAELTRNFAVAPIEQQVRRLQVMLLDDALSEKAAMIFSTATMHSSVGHRENLLGGLHPSLQIKLMDVQRDIDGRRLRYEGLSAKQNVPYVEQVAASKIPDSARARAMALAKECTQSHHDYGKIKQWLDCLLAVPFGVYQPLPVTQATHSSEEVQNYLRDVRNFLDTHVYAQEGAKRKALQLVGQWVTNGDAKGDVIGIHGPPGNGKTTFAIAGLARALQRPYFVFTLGGATDVSYFTGHSYTYKDAKEGRFVDCLIEAGCMNPLFILDEADKISGSKDGEDILGFLTDLLDPVKRNKLSDQFLDVEIYLQRAVFVLLYNDPSKLPAPLRSRITEIATDPLGSGTKLGVARLHLLPEVYEAVHLTPEDLTFSDAILTHIIEGYTREAGARQLRQSLLTIAREVNVRRLVNGPASVSPQVDEAMVAQCLTAPSELRRVSSVARVGEVNGLAYDEHGGGLQLVQCVRSRSTARDRLEITGSAGDVLKESVRLAFRVAEQLLSPEKREALLKGPAHSYSVHCPDGAQPKEGTSAGMATVMAFLSTMNHVPVRYDVAMTGETDLFGRLIGVGGVGVKLGAAKRAGARTVLVPRANAQDVEQVRRTEPELFADGFNVVLLDTVAEAIPYVFDT